MEENIAERFYDVLVVDTNPAVVLTKMYCSYYEIDFSPDLIKIFAQLIKIYGREIAFTATLEVFEWNIDDVTKPRGALLHTAKKLFEEKHSFSESTDLTSYITDFSKQVNKLRKPNVSKIKNPFTEDETNDDDQSRTVSD